jgi:hypothetical protein
MLEVGPAIVSLPVLYTTVVSLALELSEPELFSVPSALCSTLRKSLRMFPQSPLSEPGIGSLVIYRNYIVLTVDMQLVEDIL